MVSNTVEAAVKGCAVRATTFQNMGTSASLRQLLRLACKASMQGGWLNFGSMPGAALDLSAHALLHSPPQCSAFAKYSTVVHAQNIPFLTRNFYCGIYVVRRISSRLTTDC